MSDKQLHNNIQKPEQCHDQQRDPGNLAACHQHQAPP